MEDAFNRLSRLYRLLMPSTVILNSLKYNLDAKFKTLKTHTHTHAHAHHYINRDCYLGFCWKSQIYSNNLIKVFSLKVDKSQECLHSLSKPNEMAAKKQKGINPQRQRDREQGRSPKAHYGSLIKLRRLKVNIPAVTDYTE